MLEAVLPLGLPRPIALAPMEIAPINDIRGDFSGWEAFSVDGLTHRYGRRANHIELAREKRRPTWSQPLKCLTKTMQLRSVKLKRNYQRISDRTRKG
jgi:hypothetical protein